MLLFRPITRIVVVGAVIIIFITANRSISCVTINIQRRAERFRYTAPIIIQRNTVGFIPIVF